MEDTSIKYLVDDEETSLLASPPTTIAAPSRGRASNRNNYSQNDADEFDDIPSRKQPFNWHIIPIILGATMMAIMGGLFSTDHFCSIVKERQMHSLFSVTKFREIWTLLIQIFLF